MWEFTPKDNTLTSLGGEQLPHHLPPPPPSVQQFPYNNNDNDSDYRYRRTVSDDFVSNPQRQACALLPVRCLSSSHDDIGLHSDRRPPGCGSSTGDKADQHWRTKLCPFLFGTKKECERRSSCSYAHSAKDLRNRPDLTKTKLCDLYMKGHCSDSACRWAHGRHELRFTDDFYKTSLCKYWVESVCYAGEGCRHAHGTQELRPRKLSLLGSSTGTSKGSSSARTATGIPGTEQPSAVSDAGEQPERRATIGTPTAVVMPRHRNPKALKNRYVPDSAVWHADAFESHPSIPAVPLFPLSESERLLASLNSPLFSESDIVAMRERLSKCWLDSNRAAKYDAGEEAKNQLEGPDAAVCSWSPGQAASPIGSSWNSPTDSKLYSNILIIPTGESLDTSPASTFSTCAGSPMALPSELPTEPGPGFSPLAHRVSSQSQYVPPSVSRIPQPRSDGRPASRPSPLVPPPLFPTVGLLPREASSQPPISHERHGYRPDLLDESLASIEGLNDESLSILASIQLLSGTAPVGPCEGLLDLAQTRHDQEGTLDVYQDPQDPWKLRSLSSLSSPLERQKEEAYQHTGYPSLLWGDQQKRDEELDWNRLLLLEQSPLSVPKQSARLSTELQDSSSDALSKSSLDNHLTSGPSSSNLTSTSSHLDGLLSQSMGSTIAMMLRQKYPCCSCSSSHCEHVQNEDPARFAFVSSDRRFSGLDTATSLRDDLLAPAMYRKYSSLGFGSQVSPTTGPGKSTGPERTAGTGEMDKKITEETPRHEQPTTAEEWKRQFAFISPNHHRIDQTFSTDC